MESKNILILGYFGHITNQLDGQTIKTRNIYTLLKTKYSNDKVYWFDTQELQSRKSSYFKLVRKLLQCDVLVYLPGQNNLKKFGPIIHYLKLIKSFEIIHIAVGGWLYDFLCTNNQYSKYLSEYKAVLIENKPVIENIRHDFNKINALYIPNFRIHDFTPSFPPERSSSKTNLNIVFMARISMAKGIDVLFRIASKIKMNSVINQKINIDFFGPIQTNDDKAYLHNQIMQIPFADYKGILSPDEIYLNLSKYDVLILPTRYHGEGFPGSIVDAYISGIPVIVSNWKHLPEFVEHGKTGFIFDSEEELFEQIITLLSDRHLLSQMKRNAYEKSKEYSHEVAWDILKPYIEK